MENPKTEQVHPGIKFGHYGLSARVGSEDRSACYSRCETHRFSLTIRFDDSVPTLVQFVGLNPSTATELKDDRTVRRCKDFARKWGYGGMVMTNAFSFRSTSPQGIKTGSIPFEEQNDSYLSYWAGSDLVKLIVVGWGNHCRWLDRDKRVLKLLEPHSEKLHCLKINQGGVPAHPLYQPGSLKPSPFKWEDAE